MNILVTGSEGSLAQILIPKLLKEKHNVIGLDNFYRRKEVEKKREYAFENVDLTNSTSVEKVFKKYKIDSLQFVKSSEYYAEDFKTNERIYDSVRARLENEKNVLDSLVDQEREEEKAERAKKKEDKIKSLEVNKKRDSSSGRMLIKPQS